MPYVMKKTFLTLIAICMVMLQSANAQRVLGYLPSYRDPSPSLIQYDKMTDVVFSFVNPNANGTLNLTNTNAPLYNWDNNRFLTCKNNAIANNVNLWVAVGGADDNEYRSARLNSVSGNATYRANFVADLVQLAEDENLYGLAMDWEFPKNATARNNHELLMKDLYAAIKTSSNPNCLVACAIGAEVTTNPNHTQYINNNAFDYIDEIHLMAYDFPSSFGNNHSAYSDIVTSLIGWGQAHSKFDKSKVLLGLPFYGRNASRSSELEYNNFTGDPATFFDSDQHNGYYYNGKSTLEQKFEYIMDEGGLGVLIWDVGQDRTDQYSLLCVVDDKAEDLCPFAQPDLGTNQGICLPGSVTLESGVPTQSGLTYTWYKDNNIEVNASTTQTDYTVTTGGVYKVQVKLGADCMKEDEVTIVASSALSTSGDVRCGAGTVDLEVNSSGSSFDWYDAATGGTIVTNGSTYSPDLSSTDTFYVQDGSTSQEYDAGLEQIVVGDAWNDGLERHAHHITVLQDLTIQSVRVWTNGEMDISIAVVSTVDGTTVLQQSATTTVNGQGITVPVDLTLTTGEYFISAYGDDKGNNLWIQPNKSQATNISGVIDITGNCYTNFGTGFKLAEDPSAHYGQLFDWKISTGVVPPCGREMVIGEIKEMQMPGSFTKSTTDICKGDENIEFEVNNIPGGTFSWSYSGTGATITENGNAATVSFDENTATSGDLSVVVDMNNGCGDGDARTVALTVTECVVEPVADFTASATEVCAGQSITFTDASTGNPETHTWNFGTGASPAGANGAGPHTVTWSSGGTKTIQLQVFNSAGNDSKSITVEVGDAVTVADAGSNESVCATSTSLDANVPGSGETGTWSLVSGSGSFASSSNANTTVSNLGVGDNVFKWTIETASCPETSSEVTITRVGNVTVADAGDDESVCSSSTTLSANSVASGETGTWSVVSGSGSFTDASNPTTSVTGLGDGENIFEWTIANGTCPSSSDEVSITKEVTPTSALAGDDQTVCATQANLEGNTPTEGTGTWSVVSGSGTFADASNPNTTVSGLATGANIFEWTIANGCTSTNDQVTITQSGTLTSADAGSNDQLCADNTTLDANAVNTGNSETGTWSVESGSGTFADASNPTTTVSGLGVGDNVFKWTISNGTCTASFSEVTITRDASPSTADAGVSETVCETSISLNASSPTIGVGEWSLSSGTGDITDVNDALSAVSNLSVGDNVFTWTVSNGSCPSNNADVTITRVGSVTASDAGSNQSLCGTTTSLDANAPGSGETGTWSVVSGAGTFTDASDATTSVSGLSTGDNIFEWTISNSTCTPSTSQVTISVSPSVTTATAGDDQTVCGGNAVLEGNAVASGETGTWTIVAGSATISNSSSPTTAISNVTSSVTLRWTIDNGVCTNSTDDVIITEDCSLTADFSASKTSGCAGLEVDFTNLSVGTTTNATYAWDFGTNATPSTSTDENPQNVVFDEIGDYTIKLTITDGGDNSVETKTAYISVTGAPVTSPITGNTNIACSATGEEYSVVATSGSIYNWNVPNGTIVSGQGTNSITVDFNNSNGMISVAEINNGCVGDAELLFVNTCFTSIEFENEVSVNAYPNPFEESFELEIDGIEGDYQLVVYDASGITVINEIINSEEAPLLGRELVSGVYIAKVISQDKVYTFRLMKQ